LIESDIQVNPAILTAGGPAGFRITPGCAGLSGMTPFGNCDTVWEAETRPAQWPALRLPLFWGTAYPE
jgi:hypothetical protein